MPLHVSSTRAYHREVKIALYSLWYHHIYRCDDTEINILRCTVSKTSKNNIFMFHQPMVPNFYSDSDKSMASPFSFSVHNNPSLIIIITIFLSVVRSVAYSEFAISVSILDVSRLSLGLYTKAILEILCPSLLINILPKASCSYQ